MHIDVVLNNAKVSFIRKFLKIQIIFLEARRWAPSLSFQKHPHRMFPPGGKKRKEKQRKISGKGAIQSVPIPPVFLSWKLNCSPEKPLNFRPAATTAFAPPKICLHFISCLSIETQHSRENLTCTSSLCDPHLSPKTASEGLCGMAALPGTAVTLALCKTTLHSLGWPTRAERDGEGGVSPCASLEDW